MFGANNRSEHFFYNDHSHLLLCAGFRVVTVFAKMAKTCANASEKCLFFYRTMTPNGGLTRQRSENEHSVLLTCNLYEVGLTNSS